MNEPDTATAVFIKTAERVLSDAFGSPVRLGEYQSLRDKYRNRVLRCPVTHAPAGAPASVIIKASVGEGENAYDPHKDNREDTAWRFFNEWAGTRFLNERGADPALCARLLGADRAGGLIVLEDLGSGPSLADALQGDDPRAAIAALRQYAASMGRLHARTIGGEEDWRHLRRAVSGNDRASFAREGDDWSEKSAVPFREHGDALGVTIPAGFDDECAAVQRAMTEPGPFDAFAPGDTCPDNHRLTPDGSYLRFFDFEFAGFRHALLDAAYLHLPFPTCWCVARLPEDLPDELEAAYRSELRAGCPEAAADGVFHAAMSHARAYWTLATVSWGLEHALKENSDWGLSSVRQRHPLRLEKFAARSERFGHLPALSAACRALAEKLRVLWPAEETEMPLYPPFRDAAQAAQAPHPAPITFG